MAHTGLLIIGVIFIIIGIILFIIGWVLSAQKPTVTTPAPIQPGSSGWDWFLIIAGVILFIIGLIMVMLSFYWKPAVVVPLTQPPVMPQPPINFYVPPRVQEPLPPPPPPQHYGSQPPPPQYIEMPSQVIHVSQAPPNVIYDQSPPSPPPRMPSPPPPPRLSSPPQPQVRVSYGSPSPRPVISTTVQQVKPDYYDPNPVTSTTYQQPPPHAETRNIRGFGPVTGVRTPGLQAVTTTTDLPNRPSYEYQ